LTFILSIRFFASFFRNVSLLLFPLVLIQFGGIVFCPKKCLGERCFFSTVSLVRAVYVVYFRMARRSRMS